MLLYFYSGLSKVQVHLKTWLFFLICKYDSLILPNVKSVLCCVAFRYAVSCGRSGAYFRGAPNLELLISASVEYIVLIWLRDFLCHNILFCREGVVCASIGCLFSRLSTYPDNRSTFFCLKIYGRS